MLAQSSTIRTTIPMPRTPLVDLLLKIIIHVHVANEASVIPVSKSNAYVLCG